MFSDVVTKVTSLVPGLTVTLLGGPGGTGFAYAHGDYRIGCVRSMNRRKWRIDGDPSGYPFESEMAATVELFQRAPGPYAIKDQESA